MSKLFTAQLVWEQRAAVEQRERARARESTK